MARRPSRLEMLRIFSEHSSLDSNLLLQQKIPRFSCGSNSNLALQQKLPHSSLDSNLNLALQQQIPHSSLDSNSNFSQQEKIHHSSILPSQAQPLTSVLFDVSKKSSVNPFARYKLKVLKITSSHIAKKSNQKFQNLPSAGVQRSSMQQLPRNIGTNVNGILEPTPPEYWNQRHRITNATTEYWNQRQRNIGTNANGILEPTPTEYWNQRQRSIGTNATEYSN